MSFFFERSETETEIVVIHKPYYLYVFFLVLILWVAADLFPEHSTIKSIAGFAWVTAIALMVSRYFAMRKTWNEMKDAMQKGGVTMSGSKLNPSDPLTVRIPKALLSK